MINQILRFRGRDSKCRLWIHCSAFCGVLWGRWSRCSSNRYNWNGVIGIVTVTSGGSGYSTAPGVSFTNEVFESGVTTASATAHAYINGAGIVTAVYITNAGLGYSVAPTVQISAPIGYGATIGIGTFAYNEVITGSVSGNTARVESGMQQQIPWKLQISLEISHRKILFKVQNLEQFIRLELSIQTILLTHMLKMISLKVKQIAFSTSLNAILLEIHK